METRFAMHKRSRSDPVQGVLDKKKLNNVLKASDCLNLKEIEHLRGLVRPKNRPSPRTEGQTSLNQEILQLRERLHGQILVRRALEKALSYKPGFKDTANEDLIPMAAKELIEEITVLELEVIHLEEHLLSLYRKIFNRRISSLHKGTYLDVSRNSVFSPLQECDKGPGQQKKLLEDYGICRSHSSLSHRSGQSFRMSPRSKAAAKAFDSYHSLPLSMLQQAEIEALIGENSDQIPDNLLQTPNRLSEEIIRCISTVLSDLAEPPLIRNHNNQDCPLSPFSSSSSTNSHSQEFTCPYKEMGMIRSICREDQKLKAIEHKLNHYRSLVYRLEGVDPGRLNHEEKLAFWINVHNALIMHALLVHGVPKNNLKRISLTLKAAYNVGGQTFNVDTIQSSVLGCRVPRPGQWLRIFFTPKTRYKIGDARREYSIEHPEPLLHFALCSGNFSDPAVRVYTPKGVILELEAAKEDYMQSNFGISKDNKILLPKIVESYAKDSDLCPIGVIESIQNSVLCSSWKKIKRCQSRKPRKTAIDWIPHDFTFGFRFSKELV